MSRKNLQYFYIAIIFDKKYNWFYASLQAFLGIKHSSFFEATFFLGGKKSADDDFVIKCLQFVF